MDWNLKDISYSCRKGRTNCLQTVIHEEVYPTNKLTFWRVVVRFVRFLINIDLPSNVVAQTDMRGTDIDAPFRERAISWIPNASEAVGRSSSTGTWVFYSFILQVTIPWDSDSSPFDVKVGMAEGLIGGFEVMGLEYKLEGTPNTEIAEVVSTTFATKSWIKSLYLH